MILLIIAIIWIGIQTTIIRLFFATTNVLYSFSLFFSIICVIAYYVMQVLLALAMFNFFPISLFSISSGSMEPTLHGDYNYYKRDKIACDNLYYHYHDVQRGDIIAFRLVNDDNIIICKRIVGLPGDTIFIEYPDVYINGKKLYQEPFSQFEYTEYTNSSFSKKFTFACKAPFKIPPNNYFVLGDNSANSKDSRFYGAIPHRNIVGKIVCIIYPYNRMRSLIMKQQE